MTSSDDDIDFEAVDAIEALHRAKTRAKTRVIVLVTVDAGLVMYRWAPAAIADSLDPLDPVWTPVWPSPVLEIPPHLDVAGIVTLVPDDGEKISADSI